MNKKECRRCMVVKSLNEENFIKDKRLKTGYGGTCRACTLKATNERNERLKKQKKPNLTFLTCSKCGVEKPATTKYFHRHTRSLTGFKCACKACRQKETRNYNSREETKHKARQRRKQDPVWRLKKNVGSMIANSLRKSGNSKDAPCFKHLNYTAQELRQHIESQFEDWMCWDNWGHISAEKRTWNIDHIYPQSKLPYDSMEHPNFKKCWALQNLRPLCSIENVKKRDKILDKSP